MERFNQRTRNMGAMILDKKTIEEIKKSYQGYDLVIDNKNLILRNKAYNSLGVFPDGRQVIRLSNKQIVEISQLL